MEKIIMLGTGAGFVKNIYNTCFLLENGENNFLVDTGGSIQITKNLQAVGYKLTDIHNIFISHCHNDHIFGLTWIIKEVAVYFEHKINVYCNSEVANFLNILFPAIFPKLIVEFCKKNVLIHTIHDGETLEIAGEKITFFDTHVKSFMLYGFQTVLNNGAKLFFLGDKRCDPILYDKLRNADYVMHEAYCLDSEENVPQNIKEYKSTVKNVCEIMEPLNIKNLILYHTEDSHVNKKELYTKEGKQFFSNNLIVPNDLDEIILKKD